MNRLLCKDCVNFLMHKKNLCHCDYEHWTDVPYKDAILFCAEMFECSNHEVLYINNKKVKLEVHE
jgi:hypothetical protein